MKTLVVGDLHGKYEIVEEVLAMDMPTIFVGDYLDSFDRSVEDQIRTLTLVLDAIESNKAIGLMGNHELSYLRQGMRCSGYKGATAAHVIHLAERMHKLLLPFVRVEGFLITHAGISVYMLQHKGLTVEEYLEKGEHYDIGGCRGGSSHLGGLYWNDYNFEFVPVPGVNQIFGHTASQEGIREVDNNWCIDGLDYVRQILAIENGTAERCSLKRIYGV